MCLEAQGVQLERTAPHAAGGMHGKFYKPTRFYHQILCLRILIFRVAYGIDRILAPEPGRGVPSALRISRIWHILKILMPTRAIPQNIQIIQNLDILDILEWSGRVGRAAGAALPPLGRQNMAKYGRIYG